MTGKPVLYRNTHTMRHMFSQTFPWFIAEGVRNDKPALYRGRRIPLDLWGCNELPFLLVIELPFEVADHVGLPTSAQYDAIAEFEARCIDVLESQRLGITAFTCTHDGVVRYFMYVASVADVSSAVYTLATSIDGISLACDEDREWKEYATFMKRIAVQTEG